MRSPPGKGAPLPRKGLKAPQINLNKNLFTVIITNEREVTFVNPKQ